MIGEKIKKFRKKKKWTQQYLAEKSGQKRSYIAKLETGDIKNPTIKRIESIAEALGTQLKNVV